MAHTPDLPYGRAAAAAAALGFALVTSAPQVGAAEPDAARSAAPDPVSLTREFYAAVDARDVATVSRLLCARAITITPRAVISTRERFLADLRRPSTAQPPRREYGELQVHDLGATLLVTGRVVLRAAAGDARADHLLAVQWSNAGGAPCIAVAHRTFAGQAAEAATWNEAFVLGGSFNAAPNAWLQEVARGLKPGRALEVAMGQGRNGVWLATQGWNVTGFDIAGEGMRIAREAAAAQNVRIETVLASAEDFDYGREQWDLVVFIYGGGGPSDLLRAATGLRRGGHVVLEGFAAEGPSEKGRPASSVTFDRESLAASVRAAGLEVVRLETPPDARTDYGPADARPIRLLARRP